ncbi:MAG TPA: LLM class flavin-dependent oxidoreductase [Aliidongia sp.]|uniref:LLM class flavin-dependent oxidoreductase n=1 Tax=Aliidongia sp. TaxID=1914230 RepID=UPI002DDCD6E1|nr:LLM class flavin-dependent oxidoreductase [Aliidongia sp.]HEV2675814.1 LLM class flavin-dependent oxidoreductase [Aliidongia sp.]
MTALSILDLSPIPEGHDARHALLNSLDLARHAERLGFQRYWVAEHHNMPGIASAATSVVIGHIAGGTKTIRVGAGGVMLPNHSPLVIAEQFGTLASLYPGRIDLGVGRAPGSDQLTARALRRNLEGEIDAFPQDVMELIGYFAPASPNQRIFAVPGVGTGVPVWILGSSTYGAQLAAAFGLPYAFASHFAPDQMGEAIDIYRQRFRPSASLDKPHLMLGIGAFAAETDEEARRLFTSQQQAFVNLRRGRPGPLPRPVDDLTQVLSPAELAMVEHSLACRVVGSPDTIRRGLEAFIRQTGADELMVTGAIHDHPARLRSFEIVAEAHRALGAAQSAAAD